MAKDDGAMSTRAITAIERNATAQARLIEDLLDIARIARGGLHLELAATDLAAVSLAALDAVKPQADEKGVALVSAIGEVGTIHADATRIRQVICNLLINAVKFTPSRGQVTLDVRRAGDEASVVVTDTGVGISPEVLPHVFERYKQGQRGGGGLGLGLAIAASVAELHGGALRAASDGVGRGARFELTLPVRATAASGAADTAGTERSVRRGSSPGLQS
jgi:signal transduction histidine kinase